MTRGLLAATALLALSAATAQAQAPYVAMPGLPPPPPPAPAYSYGPPITLEQAKRVVAATLAEAQRRNVKATFAIADISGALVYYERATDAPYSAEEFAVKKARASARTRRATKWDMDRYAAGITAVTAVDDIFPFGGGQPILFQGKVVGAIGVTGGADDDIAVAGARALQ